MSVLGWYLLCMYVSVYSYEDEFVSVFASNLVLKQCFRVTRLFLACFVVAKFEVCTAKRWKLTIANSF